MSFKSFLSAIGHDAVNVFKWLGSAQGQATITGVETAATTVATLINPAAGLALTGIETLINAGLKEVVSIETVAVAAGSQSGTGAQKSAAVIASISPQVEAFLNSIGVKDPKASDIQNYATQISNAIVTILNVLPAPPVA